MTKFWLQRNVDVTGISGTGIVAEGVVFTDGTAVMHWLSKESTLTTFSGGLEQIERLHGHGGASVLVLDKPNVSAGRLATVLWDRPAQEVTIEPLTP